MLKRVSLLVAAALLLALPTGVSAYASRTGPNLDLALTSCDNTAGPYVLHLYWDQSSGKPTEYQVDPDPSFHRVTATAQKAGYIDVGAPGPGSYSVQLTNRWGGSIHDVSCQ